MGCNTKVISIVYLPTSFHVQASNSDKLSAKEAQCCHGFGIFPHYHIQKQTYTAQLPN